MKLWFWDFAVWFLENCKLRRLPIKIEDGIAVFCFIKGVYNVLLSVFGHYEPASVWSTNYFVFCGIMLTIMFIHDAYLVNLDKSETPKTIEMQRLIERFDEYYESSESDKRTNKSQSIR